MHFIDIYAWSVWCQGIAVKDEGGVDCIVISEL